MGNLRHSNGNGSGTGNGPEYSETEVSLVRFLRAAESDYDQDLSDERIEQWMGLLKAKQRFSLQEITEAFSEVQLAQPGGWTGFPRRPDVLAQMMRTREHKAEHHKNAGGWDFRDEDCPLCRGIGWIQTQTDRGNTAAKRCECGERKLTGARADFNSRKA